MKKIIVITTLIITLLTVVGMKFISPITQEKPQEEEIDWFDSTAFDCDNYNYYPKIKEPNVTHEDSIKLQIYMDWHNREIFNKFPNLNLSKLREGKQLWRFLPYLYYDIDTLWRKKILAGYQYKNLSLIQMDGLIYYAAVFKGKIVKKRRINDSRCLYYKTEYIIEVQDMVHTYINLKKGDLVITKDVVGYVAGCRVGGDKKIRDFSHHYDYEEGEESLFVLDKVGYDISFMGFLKRTEHNYQDVYCSNAFDFTGNKKWLHQLNELKEFFNEVYGK